MKNKIAAFLAYIEKTIDNIEIARQNTKSIHQRNSFEEDLELLVDVRKVFGEIFTGLDTAYEPEEIILHEVIMNARKVQDYIWEGDNLRDHKFEESQNIWVRIFQKRVDKIKEIVPLHSSMKTELRKRILQQAALSILALRILDDE